MTSKIDGYVDCASPYSYFAMKYLRERRDLLKQYNVEVEFHPFFLGGVNHATGNKPPSTLPAKAKFGSYDLRRACTFFDTTPLTSPPFFPMVSLLPQRSMVAVKARHPRDKFEAVYESCWLYCFERHRDLAQQDTMRDLLREHFDAAEAEEILKLAATAEVKEVLAQNTKDALEKGAFGAPWFWLTNGKTGESEPLFGSDRWSYMFRFLGVEVRELSIVDKEEDKGKEKARL